MIERASNRLIFHPPHAEGAESAAFAEALREVLDASEGPLCLVSPYWGESVMRELVRGRVFRFITDLDACLQAGHPGELSQFLSEHPGSWRHLPSVHAKVFLSDGAALFGSANLTKQGLSARDEVGMVVREGALVRSLHAWFEALWEVAQEITPDALNDTAMHHARVPRARIEPAPALGPLLKPRASKPKRSLGWLTSAKRVRRTRSSPRVMTSAPHDPHMLTVPHTLDDEHSSHASCDELCWVLRRRTPDEASAVLVLQTLYEALYQTGLTCADAPLHLAFLTSGSPRIHVTVGGRYVAWLDRGLFGLILCPEDEALAERLARRFGGDTYYFKKPTTPSLLVPVARLEEALEEVRDSWCAAIDAEVRRGRRSPFKRALRPELEVVLRCEACRLAHAARAHDPAIVLRRVPT